MIRTIGDTVIAFDCEWIPDIPAARFIEQDAQNATDEQCLDILWLKNGATEETPHPFLKLAQSQLVSIAMMVRKTPLAKGQPPELSLTWLPKNCTDKKQYSEKQIISTFLAAVERRKPQLVGFNSKNSDLRILMQRALILGIPAKGFLERPAKPWEGIDYFARDNEGSIDLMDLIVGGYNRSATLNLNEICTLCGIPGKFDSHGNEVFDYWQQNKMDQIIQYNCYDAISTYLLWLRLAWISGTFSTSQYEEEVGLTRDYLMGLAEQPETSFVEKYLLEWDRLSALYESQRGPF
jgi:predicted PolB exonuclease-like 3'-5' exonuclease